LTRVSVSWTLFSVSVVIVQYLVIPAKAGIPLLATIKE
jgi:hypothetical protein